METPEKRKINKEFLIFIIVITAIIWIVFSNIGATIILFAVGMLFVAMTAQTDSEKEIIENEIKDKEKRKEQLKIDKEKFYDELKEIPGYDFQASDFFGTKREIDYLYQMLRLDEKILSMASGYLNGKTVLLVCTNKRCVFIDCGMIYKVSHSEIMINKINSVSTKNELMFSSLVIEDGASVRVITNIRKKYIQSIVDSIHDAMEMSKLNIEINTNNSISGADELIKYKQLLDMGAITDEEFEKKKRTIIGE